MSYKNNKRTLNSKSDTDSLESLYDVSLTFDKQKIIEKAQRQIYDLLAKSGRSGVEVSYLQELIKFDKGIINKAIQKLGKLKRIVWINNKTIALVDSIKFVPGRKYSVFIEKVLFGKAIVVVDDKWYASLDHYDYLGPRTLIKKGNSFNVIGEIYRRNGSLHLSIKKII
jgi:hypothetical protein